MLKKCMLLSLMTVAFVAHASLDSTINNIINDVKKHRSCDSYLQRTLYDLGQFLLDDKEPCAKLTVTKYPGVNEIHFANSQKNSSYLFYPPKEEAKNNNSIFDNPSYVVISLFLLKCCSSRLYLSDIEKISAIIHGNVSNYHLTSRHGTLVMEEKSIPITVPTCEISTQTIPIMHEVGTQAIPTMPKVGTETTPTMHATGVKTTTRIDKSCSAQ